MAPALVKAELTKLGCVCPKIKLEGVTVTQWPSPLCRLRLNRLGDEGTITICKALSESKASKLQELDLADNRIGVPGAKALAALLAVHASLTSVWSPATNSCP